MKALLNAIIAFLEQAITNGDISQQDGQTATVHKGFSNQPAQFSMSDFPYITVDDGGERIETIGRNTQKRIYSVLVELGSYVYDSEAALDGILDFYTEVKAVFEKEVNRQKDGFNNKTFALEVTPFTWENDGNFFKGRRIIVEYQELEDYEYDY